MVARKNLGLVREEIIFKYRNNVPLSELAKQYDCHDSTMSIFLRKCGEPTKLKKFTQKDIDAILDLHSKGISGRQIEKQLGLTHSTISRIFAKLGIDISERQCKRDIPLFTNTEDIIKRYTNGESMVSIAKLYNAGLINIKNILVKSGIKIRKGRETGNAVDETFFEMIDTQEKAYVLGYFMADGCNYRKGYNCSLEITDLEILEKIAKVMKFEGEIKIQPREGIKTVYRMRIGSKKMSDDLIKLGCIPNKSKFAQFPIEEIVPKHLIQHLIRGWQDGDGCITKSEERNSWRVIIVGTEDVAKGFSNVCFNQFGFCGSISKDRNIYRFCIGAKLQVKTFLDWLYKDSTIHLERKYQKYQEFLAEYGETEELKEGLKQEEDPKKI